MGTGSIETINRLRVGEPTVCVYVSSILNKRYLTNRTQAALYAIREGLSDAI